MRKPQQSGQFLIETDGRTVWINHCVAGAVGRFSAQRMDVHNKENTSCVDCGQNRSFKQFQKAMLETHGVEVPDQFNPDGDRREEAERVDKLTELNTDLPYQPTYAQDAPLVQELSKNGCYRCAVGQLHTLCGFPGNFFHHNGVWILKSAIPHTCKKHELLLGGDEFPDPKVWFQVSRRYRTVARLPEGMNGNQALIWAMEQYQLTYENNRRRELADHRREWAERMPERCAADHFLRCYTCYKFAEHLQQELTPRQFDAFRKHGGSTCY